MKISVIIPAFNEERYIEKCLESVVKNGSGLFSEIIVVDNASTDRTAEIARRFVPVRVVYEPKKGTNNARQRGMEEASGDILAYLDADMEVDRSWFVCIQKEFKNNSKLVCLSGPFYYHDLSTARNYLVWVYWNFLAFPFYWMFGYMAGGGNSAIKNEALQKVGGFNTVITFYGDDTDTAQRLHKVGKVLFTKRLKVYTSSRRFKGQGFLKTGLLYAVNFLYIAILRRPFTAEHKDIR